jgi:tetratricopeptide (TPR) repeat protein
MIWFFALLLFGATGRSAPPPAAPFAQVSKKAAAAREANRLDDAVRLYRESVRLRPNWTEGWWYLGTLLYDQDRYPEARSALRRFTALDPKAGPGWALLGLCEFETKEYRQAGEHLERARKLGIEANPQLTEVASFHEALLLTRFEKYEAALEILIDFARRGQDKPAMLEAAGIAALRKPMLPAELAEGDRELVMQVGRAVMDTGARRMAQAQKEFEEIIAHHPGEPQLLYLYGSFLLISDPEAGMRELKKAVELSPRLLPAVLQIAFEYLKRGDASAALPYARQGVEIDPQSFVAHNALGRALVESGEVQGGIKELEISKQQAPDSPQTRIALASAYAKAGRPEDAARERAEFLKLKQLSKKTEEP